MYRNLECSADLRPCPYCARCRCHHAPPPPDSRSVCYMLSCSYYLVCQIHQVLVRSAIACSCGLASQGQALEEWESPWIFMQIFACWQIMSSWLVGISSVGSNTHFSIRIGWVFWIYTVPTYRCCCYCCWCCCCWCWHCAMQLYETAVYWTYQVQIDSACIYYYCYSNSTNYSMRLLTLCCRYCYHNQCYRNYCYCNYCNYCYCCCSYAGYDFYVCYLNLPLNPTLSKPLPSNPRVACMIFYQILLTPSYSLLVRVGAAVRLVQYNLCSTALCLIFLYSTALLNPSISAIQVSFDGQRISLLS